MMSMSEWLTDISENYSVENFDDITNGIFVAKITDDTYLMSHKDVKECPQK